MDKSDKQQTSNIRVSVHLYNGQLCDKEARVILIRGKEQLDLKRSTTSLYYEDWVEIGTYQLDVTVGDLVSPPRTVTVGSGLTTVNAYLGKPDWPFYHFGDNCVPFKPHDDLVGVAFPDRKPERDEADKALKGIMDRLRLEPFIVEYEKGERGNIVADGAIWLFRLTDGPIQRESAMKGLREALGPDARIGMPVDLEQQQVKILDNRFVVRFRDDISAKDIERLVAKEEGHVIRSLVQAKNTRLIEFAGDDYRKHLAIIERWYDQDLLVYGEPDLMAEITDDVFPNTAPDDPTFGTQANLTLQNVDDAWQYLYDKATTLTLGSPDVFVATLDRGVDTDHPDIGGNLTDGTPQLAQCYDFSGLRACTAVNYAPDTSHGMGVYGIISALTNNTEDIAGIAPNVHHIGLERPNLTSANYPDVLLWAAGFTTNNTSAGWPAEPITPAADVISCSHGSNGLALSGIMNDTFNTLATQGRGGRGTLVVYSAGNSNSLITGFRTWAAHARTMAIANSMQPNAAGVEQRDATSNFGPEIDICAQGTNAPSLNDTGGEQTFGGTSAAAPTVAAAACLMLSAKPNMSRLQLRDMLRDQAVVIDGTNNDPVGQWVNGFSQWYGFGRLDVLGSVQEADLLGWVNQGAWRPGTNNYEFGFNSIPTIPITGAPADTNFRRWAMLHDGSAYRMYFFKGNSSNTLYQFSWNGSSYAFGHNSIPVLTLVDMPADADASSFSMLHSGGNYHLYLRRLGDPRTLLQFVWEPGTTTYKWGPGSWLKTLRVTDFPVDTDWSRWQMLHDGNAYRIYAFPYGANNRLYQGSWNSILGAYQYGFNSINQLDLIGFPPDSDVGRPAMLHDGRNYRFYFQML